MVFRRRVYRRRPIRRRRIVRKPRVPRPLGSGFLGKRFFKIKQTGALALGGTGGTVFYNGAWSDLPATTSNADWIAIAQLFDEYRVCALKIKYIPSGIINTTSPAPIFTPVYVYHDVNSILTNITNIDLILAYESCKVKSLQRPWTYYRKMVRNIPVNTSWTSQVNMSARGYIPTDSPTATQCIAIYCTSTSTLPAGTYGTMVCTTYIAARARK